MIFYINPYGGIFYEEAHFISFFIHCNIVVWFVQEICFSDLKFETVLGYEKMYQLYMEVKYEN